MRSLITLLLLITGLSLHAQPYNYIDYHKQIIAAEDAIFVRHDSIKDLELFPKTFNSFGFMYVDDCIEAFEARLFASEGICAYAI